LAGSNRFRRQPELRGFDFYAAKDRVMAEEASYGFMIWDGKRVGTLMNVLRLIDRNKIVVVYVGPTKEFFDLKNENGMRRFIENYASELKTRLQDQAASELRGVAAQSQLVWFEAVARKLGWSSCDIRGPPHHATPFACGAASQPRISRLASLRFGGYMSL
jgi:hypothetical protein